MALNIRMETGVASQFKGNMQVPYDFLNSCATSAKSCQILEVLNFDGGAISYVKQNTEKVKGNITSLLNSVENCENDFIELDQKGSEQLETELSIEQETANADTPSKNEVIDNEKDTSSTKTTNNNKVEDNSKTNIASNDDEKTNENETKNNNAREDDKSNNKNTDTENTTKENQEKSSSKTTENNYNNAATTSSNNNSNKNNSNYTTSNSNKETTPNNDYNTNNNDTVSNIGPVSTNDAFKFEFDRNTAFSNGDIFIDEKYSLTDFTNYILYKYKIKDENVAKAIYNSIINYGNNYYQSYHKNPITSVSEKTILSEVYKQISDIVSNSNENTFWNMLKNI